MPHEHGSQRGGQCSFARCRQSSVGRLDRIFEPLQYVGLVAAEKRFDECPLCQLAGPPARWSIRCVRKRATAGAICQYAQQEFIQRTVHHSAETLTRQYEAPIVIVRMAV